MFAVYNFLFVGLNILFAKRYAFVRSNTDVRALWKNIWKIKFSKYSQEWSCFEDLDIKNTFVQSEFNLDIHSVIYGFFFASNFFACGWCHCFVLSICMHMLFYFYVQTVNSQIYLAEKGSTTRGAFPWSDGCPVAFNDIRTSPYHVSFFYSN